MCAGLRIESVSEMSSSVSSPALLSLDPVLVREGGCGGAFGGRPRLFLRGGGTGAGEGGGVFGEAGSGGSAGRIGSPLSVLNNQNFNHTKNQRREF